MAQRKKDGTYELETNDYMSRGVEDCRRGRASSAPGGITAAQSAAYTDAYNWGAWFKLQFDRNYI